LIRQNQKGRAAFLSGDQVRTIELLAFGDLVAVQTPVLIDFQHCERFASAD
jgi:hypothetical protein